MFCPVDDKSKFHYLFDYQMAIGNYPDKIDPCRQVGDIKFQGSGVPGSRFRVPGCTCLNRVDRF